jgi:hypothetical protein
MHHIRVGGEGADFFTLAIRERQFPEATDYWKANWLTCDVEVSAGAFRGAFGAVIRNEALDRFLRGLRLLYEGASGTATLEEPNWLSVDVFAEGDNQMKVWCQVSDNCNNLECNLALDRVNLLTIIQQIERVCTTYPVVAYPATKPITPCEDRGR